MARVADRWERARARHVHALERHEGRDVFVATQRFLRTTAKLARERPPLAARARRAPRRRRRAAAQGPPPLGRATVGANPIEEER